MYIYIYVYHGCLVANDDSYGPPSSWIWWETCHVCQFGSTMFVAFISIGQDSIMSKIPSLVGGLNPSEKY